VAGRNFANKLWNASKYALSRCASVDHLAWSTAMDMELDLPNLALHERWISLPP
jgi:valyl-tRNA synthetase